MRILRSVALAFAAVSVLFPAVGATQTVDRGTVRHGMHCCPEGQYVVGIHASDNLLLCDPRFGTYTAAQEIVDRNTVAQGMHACPEGMAMTGFHEGNNLITCAPIAQVIPRFVDNTTVRFGMLSCPEGSPVTGIHVGRNLLLCGTQGMRQNAETEDAGTVRHQMHSCPEGQYVVGIHVGNNLLLCAPLFGIYSASQEVVMRGNPDDPNTRSHGMIACPEGMAVTGVHVGNNVVACAPVMTPRPRFVDATTVRSGMHACPEGSPVSGLHVGNNLLLCDTQFSLRVRTFTAQPTRVHSGEKSTLRWDVDCNAPDCNIRLVGPGVDAIVATNSSQEVMPTATAGYSLTAKSGGGSERKEVRVEVQQGFSRIAVTNCNSAERPVNLWTRDLTTNSSWVDHGVLNYQGSGGTCPVGQPTIIPLTDGHQYDFVAVDRGALNCNDKNDPTIVSCQKYFVTAPIPGSSSGGTALVQIF